MGATARFRNLGQPCCLLLLAVVLPTLAAAADHLLLGEVVLKVRPPASLFGSEYVEILNPTAIPFDLSDVYLTDATFSGQGYWQLVEGGGAGLGGTSGDFHARFPAGLFLRPGETLVISLEGSTLFQSAYGLLPDLELYEDDLVPDGVPEMREAFPGSIGAGLGSTESNGPLSDGWLGDAGESLVLYTWDGAADLVQDLDYLTWGIGSVRVDKTGLSMDGPDADGVATAYLPDTPSSSQSTVESHAFAKALVRTDPDESGESLGGGNGVGGHDETSEPMATTWSSTAEQDPSLLGSLIAPAPILLDVGMATSVIHAGEPAGIIATQAAVYPPRAPVVFWSADGGAWSQATALESGGVWRATIPAQPEGAVVRWWLLATGYDGGTTTYPANAPFYAETYTVQEAPEPGAGPVHLQLTEVCVQSGDHEFIEITNPTPVAVPLDDYYLTDAVYLTQGYWMLPAGNPSQITVGGGEFYDFHGRFPDGASIGPGESLTIAVAGSEAFRNAWGVDPDFELREDGAVADSIPDLREIFPGSLWGSSSGDYASLTNSSEIVCLYYWDGTSDLVTDVDMVLWGPNSSIRVQRDGVTIGSSTYAADTPVADQDAIPATHELGGSFQRFDPDEGAELTWGGNGPGGHDETSENLSVTWQANAVATPGVFVASGIFFLTADTSPTTPDGPVTVTGTLAGWGEAEAVTLHYAVDGGPLQAVACGEGGAGAWSGDVPQQPVGTVVTWYLRAEESFGDEAYWPVGAPSEVSSYTVEEIHEPVPAPPHLLLTEVCVTANDHEFVEIYNPTAAAVDLSNYYLTDAVHYMQGFWRLPEGNPTSDTVGGGAFYDFNARFPAGAVLPPRTAVTVAITGSGGYTSVWGRAPDFVLVNPTAADIPEMRDVFPGSRRGDPVDDAALATLVNGGELVVLYYWDQVSNLVKDIDIFSYGTTTGTARVDRNQYTINGESYAPDTPVSQQDVFVPTHTVGESYQRLAVTEGTEPESGGNGTLGHDETGENLMATWTIDVPSPGGYFLYPSIMDAEITPAAPLPTDTTRVEVTIRALEGVLEPELRYRLVGHPFQDVIMIPLGANRWQGSILPLPADSVVEWYVRCSDGVGSTAQLPEAAPDSLFAFVVTDVPITPHLNLHEGEPGPRILYWDPPTDSLFQTTCVYRALPGEEFGEPLTCTVDNYWQESSYLRYVYAIRLRDVYGRLSAWSNLVESTYPTAVGDQPPAPGLGACSPNPFNAMLSVDYVVPDIGDYRLVVYDLKGRVVSVLDAGEKTAGPQTLVWDGRGRDASNAPSGLYMIAYEYADRRDVRLVSLLK